MKLRYTNNGFLSDQLRRGNAKAYDYLMETYYRQLCVYACTLTKCKVQAEDIVQNVFVSVWLHRRKINPDYSIKSLLYKSVYNEFVDQYRKNRPVIYLEKKYLEVLDSVIEKEQHDLGEIIAQLNIEIDRLPPKCKRIFVLNKKEGLTHTEISEYLDISIKTVEGHITRAFKILSKKLGAHIEPILFLIFGYRNQIAF
ncbi:RNA polymerase sigma factor [Ulvibacterium sp.]|uniref:RNA polymerase sigma factor n=1 Tax=Ulvibacterium sp. TaxID=2665914 RepID=UPI003BA92BF7